MVGTYDCRLVGQRTKARGRRPAWLLKGSGSPPARGWRRWATKAGDLATSINNQHLQISLQLNNSLSWPFTTILISWACLLFFGFGMLARSNRASVAGLAVGAISVASAIFLIVELSEPYFGVFILSPAPVLQTIEAIDS